MNRSDEYKLITATNELKDLGLPDKVVDLLKNAIEKTFKKFNLDSVEEIIATKKYDISMGGDVYSILVFAIDDDGNQIVYDKSHVIYS